MTDYPLPLSAEQARRQQIELAAEVVCQDRLPAVVRRVAGVDVAYSLDETRLAAAAVVLDADSLEPLESAEVVEDGPGEYQPGLFALRELPPLCRALARLSRPPDLIVCDGHGRAHPRRFGLACHLGVLLDIPTIGCAKTLFVGSYEAPGPRRGDRTPLVHEGETVGAVLRTRDQVKPMFVSVGHRVSLDTACARVLRLAPRYRLPETTRRADRHCRAVLKDHNG